MKPALQIIDTVTRRPTRLVGLQFKQGHQMSDDIYYRRHLPHYQPPEATYFVTFRLAGSLPNQVMPRLKQRVNRRKRVWPTCLNKNMLGKLD
ncbi:MAG TPA: hypothetical protein PKW76_16175 [bacterium]|nr:hypothetical protein [bacterium]